MKRILIILGIVAIVLLAGFLAVRSWTKSKSPEAKAEITQNGLTAQVDYCQPAKKGRKIFGGLVPYGQVWRTGANEATIIRFDENVLVAGQPLDKGKYSLWTIPSADNWIAIFNSETGQWGTSYDATKDVLRVPISAHKTPEAAESFVISFSPQADVINMLLKWDQTEAVVPIRKRSE